MTLNGRHIETFKQCTHCDGRGRRWVNGGTHLMGNIDCPKCVGGYISEKVLIMDIVKAAAKELANAK